MVKREKIVITIFAAVIVLAIGLNLSSWPQKDIPHVTMYSSYDIRNVESLFNFEGESIQKIKVTTWGNLTYLMKRDESGIHVQIRNEENELLTETTCGDFLFYYEPYSWSLERVQLQSCKPGQEIYDLGGIAL